MLHTKLCKIVPVVLEKKMLTDDGQRTMDDNGRHPIAIGHLSDSGDLNKLCWAMMTNDDVKVRFKTLGSVDCYSIAVQ